MRHCVNPSAFCGGRCGRLLCLASGARINAAGFCLVWLGLAFRQQCLRQLLALRHASAHVSVLAGLNPS